MKKRTALKNFTSSGERRAWLVIGLCMSACTATQQEERTTEEIETDDTDTFEDFEVPVDAPPLSGGTAYLLYDATRFIYTGENPMQRGADADAISKVRVAALKGRVFDRRGRGLSGVTVSVVGDDRYGTTETRADGRYDLVVNAEGRMTLRFEKEGVLPAERAISPRAQRYNFVDDVALVALSTVVSKTVLGDDTAQAAEGSSVLDNDGERRAILLFPPDLEAAAVLPDGSEAPLDQAAVRMTEFTVGASGPRAMPGTLPPTSAYTYALSLHIDEAAALGAESVRFNRAVSFYVDNFLHFAPGTAVPVGYYDPADGLWKASASGRVVTVTADGGLDMDGDGVSESDAYLAAVGVQAWELEQIERTLVSGQSYWRVSMTHFSSWDCNWPVAPPPGATPPPPPPKDNNTPPKDKPCRQNGSIVMCETQTLGEQFPIAGTPYSLVYMSDRVRDRMSDNRILVPLTATEVPEALKRIELEVDIAGRRVQEIFSPDPDLLWTFEWDGTDAYGREVKGAAVASVRIGYVYDGTYQEADSFGQSGSGDDIERVDEEPITDGIRSGADDPDDAVRNDDDEIVTDVLDGKIDNIGDFASADEAREEITLWREARYTLGRTHRPDGIATGVSLNVHHSYDPEARVLHLGSGDRRSAASLDRTVRTVWRGHADTLPQMTAAAPDGSIYFSDEGNKLVFRRTPDGTVETVAGNGDNESAGDGGPAIEASFQMITGLAAGADGALFVADALLDEFVRKVDRTGEIQTVAGGGDREVGDTPIPAVSAKLWSIGGLAADGRGGLYLLDAWNDDLLYLTAEGTIYRAAGKGETVPDTAGIPAADADLGNLMDVAVGPDDSVYIVGRYLEGPVGDTYYTHRVYRMTPDGTVRRIAGGGFPGSAGTAVETYLEDIHSIAVRNDGRVYLARFNGRIDYIDETGNLVAYAGCGDTESCGEAYADLSVDNLPALASNLTLISDVAVDTFGNVFFSDPVHHRIRQVHVSLPSYTEGDAIIASSDGAELYVFNYQGRHLETQNALTGETIRRFLYDDRGRLTGVEETGRLTTRIERDAAGNPTAVVSPYGVKTALTTGDAGTLTSIAAPDGSTTTLWYEGGLLTGMTDAGGNTYAYTYDELGRLISDADPIEAAAGAAKTLTPVSTVDGSGVTFRTAMGRETQYLSAVNSEGESVRTVIGPDGTQAQTVETVTGKRVTVLPNRMTRETRVRGDARFAFQSASPSSVTVRTPSGKSRKTEFEKRATPDNPETLFDFETLQETQTVQKKTYSTIYDAAEMTRTEISPEGRTATTGLDALGRTVSLTHPSGYTASLFYDDDGRIDTISAADGVSVRTVQISYDENGYFSGLTDTAGRETRVENDVMGRPVAVSGPDGRRTEAAFDALGNLVSIAPPGRPAHSFRYTPVSLPDLYAPPEVDGVSDSAVRYTYDLDRKRTSAILPDGCTVTYLYDDAGRLTEVGLPNDERIAVKYDGTTGQPAELNGPSDNTLAFVWDGDLLTDQIWSGAISGSVEDRYDNEFSLKSRTVNGGDAVSFAYDNDGLLIEAGDLSLLRDAKTGAVVETETKETESRISYNGFGDPLSESYEAKGETIYAWTVQYDDLGRIVEKRESVSGETVLHRYEYDTAGRLVSVSRDGETTATVAYEYDENSNRLRRTDGTTETVEEGRYDAQDRMTAYGGATYTYTDSGKLTAKHDGDGGVTTYDYDVLGNLRGVVLPDGMEIEYLVDAEGRRIGKVVDGTLEMGLLYKDRLNPIAELDADGAVVSRFVYGSKSNVPAYFTSTKEDGQTRQTYRILSDHLGSVRLVINATTGAVVQRLDYDAFGRILRDTNPGFQPFGFSGGLYDPDTRLTRFGARDYDPETGRWTAKDPILFDGGDTNLYGYVMNNPVSRLDPSGHFAAQIIGGIIGAVAGGIMESLNGGDGRDIARAALIGVGAGVMSTLGRPSIVMSAAASTLGNILNQATSPCNKGIDVKEVLVAGFVGGMGGAAGKAVSKATSSQGLEIFTEAGKKVFGAAASGAGSALGDLYLWL